MPKTVVTRVITGFIILGACTALLISFNSARTKLKRIIVSLENRVSNLEAKEVANDFEKIKLNPPIFGFFQTSRIEREELIDSSKSQLKQDIFVYLESNRKRNGFFVEFGATDGISLSNSYMLEQKFGWHGILAEPAIIWHEKLKTNRPNSSIETSCVWKDTGSKLIFNETDAPELSTIESFTATDHHKLLRANGNKYEVSTISLLDLLKKYNAPQFIDYLSIDTEGSEFDILEAFFNSNNYYTIKIITCEHNYTSNRDRIYDLLTKHGYQRKYLQASFFDDFYVLQ